MADRDMTRRELLGPVGDGAVLASLLRVEHVLVFAYERALAAGVLSPSAQPILSSLLEQERAHVHALSVDLTGRGGLGGTAPAPLKGTAAFESELRHLRVRRSPARLRNERQYVRFLIDLEMLIARHYRYAIARLNTGKALSLAAEIMANEAQHATAMSELLSPGNVKRAVPSAFVGA
jgi:Ferritin-like domain